MKIGGYPKTQGGRRVFLMSWDGKEVVAKGNVISCKKVHPQERGGWISNERCSYHFEKDGVFYSGRGRGDGVFMTARAMKRKPR